jgi:hypothetical protein
MLVFLALLLWKLFSQQPGNATHMLKLNSLKKASDRSFFLTHLYLLDIRIIIDHYAKNNPNHYPVINPFLNMGPTYGSVKND